MERPKAPTFDVFGTVVDWRTSIAREARAFAERHGIETDWERFADDERGLGPVIASLSLGVARIFRIRSKDGSGTRSVGLSPAHGDLVVMWGCFQRDFKHALPRSAGVVQERLDPTLRRIETRTRTRP